MASRRHRPGFSLIEALVVLAISGMALAIIFSIGVKAGDSGFALGRRAMSAADQDMAASDLRSLIRSVEVRPERTFDKDIDRPYVGFPERFEADVVMERATQCAPAGWAGRLVLSVERLGPGVRLMCRAGDRQTTLIETPNPAAALSYSRNGRTWVPTMTNTPASDADTRPVMSDSLYVRFSGAPGNDILEMASSGRPEAWVRFQDEF